MHDLYMYYSWTLPIISKERKVSFFGRFRHVGWPNSLSDAWISQSGNFRASDRDGGQIT